MTAATAAERTPEEAAMVVRRYMLSVRPIVQRGFAQALDALADLEGKATAAVANTESGANSDA